MGEDRRRAGEEHLRGADRRRAAGSIYRERTGGGRARERLGGSMGGSGETREGRGRGRGQSLQSRA